MASYKKLKFQITGVSPLLLHNGQLADPMNKFSQAMKKISTEQTTESSFEQGEQHEENQEIY